MRNIHIKDLKNQVNLRGIGINEVDEEFDEILEEE